MTEQERKLLEQQNLSNPDFGTGSMLMRPEDTSIQGASNDFMQYLNNPTANMIPPKEEMNNAPIEDFDAMNEQDTLEKRLSSVPSTPAISTPISRSPAVINDQDVNKPSIESTPQMDILAQLKAAREANAASLAGARQSDRMTELGNIIMKSGSQIGQGLLNRTGTTNIKLDPLQAAAEETKFAGMSNKERIENLMQDYGIIKSKQDTEYKHKADEQARKDKLSERAEDRTYKNRMLDIAENKAKSDKKEQDNAGQKKLDQEMAKEYQEWSSGGQKIAQSEIDKLKGVLRNLKTGKVTTGGITGMFPDQLTTNKTLGARSDVQSSVMGSLRQLLGAQFTEKEGERVIKNTWNEADSVENNIERIDRLINDLENKAKDKSKKASYFQEKGSTLKGFKNDFSKSDQLESKQNSPSIGSIIKSNGKRYKIINASGDLEEIK